MVVPGAYFASQIAKSDEYSFMRASGNLDVISTKNLGDQWDTAVRVRYPQMRQRPEAVALLIIAEIVLLLLPIWLFLAGFALELGLLWVLSGICTVVYGLVHLKIYKSYKKSGEALSLFLLPVSIIFEILTLIVSMYSYEFRSVIWKERDICIPVMRSIPKLPKV
jgi:hypothetical protein